MSWCVIFCFVFCFSVTVFGSNESKSNQPQNSIENSNADSTCSVKCEDFKAVETKNGEQGKVIEKLIEQVELLSQKVDQLENKILENEGVGMLRAPLRGPPGRKGEMGDQGLIGSKGDRGEKGEKGPPGQSGPQGNSGRDGKAGEKGEKGPAGSKGDRGVSALEASISSCSVAMEILPSSRSKKQSIYPHGNTNKVEALCDFETDGGGWTIIQKRSSGPKQEFNRNWTEYQKGFGSVDKNFWMGLENIHALTKNGDQELRIELEDFEGNKRYAKYSSFSVSAGSDFYRLSISGYSGDAGNDMIPSSFPREVHNGMRFSTWDKDNTPSSSNCAEYWSSGWWFNNCHKANLNGLYFEKEETVPNYNGTIWYSWKGRNYSLAKTEMKIRTRK